MFIPVAIAAVLFAVAGVIAIMMLWPAFATAVFVVLKPEGAPMSQDAMEALKAGFAWSCVECHCIALAVALTGRRGRA